MKTWPGVNMLQLYKKRIYFYGNTAVLDSIVYYTEAVHFTRWPKLFGL